MNAKQRREAVRKAIMQSEEAISAGTLAKQFHVSRQLIVGDVALLRAQGNAIIATPRGYVNEQSKSDEGIIRKIAVEHRSSDLEAEIYTVVDLGGAMLDVVIDHPLYGELCGSLHIESRYDANQFFQKVQASDALPLSALTNGVHLHTIRCRDEETYARIVDALREQGFLYENDSNNES